MIVIWTGRGFWTFPIIVGIPGLLAAIVTLAWGEAAWDSRPWLLGLGLLGAAAVNWLVGRRLNSQPARVLVDQKTGKKVRWKRRNTIFFLPMEYWSAPIALWGVYLVVRSFLH